jgi:predicted nucleotidyltransferase
MRLSDFQINSIKSTVKEVFGDATTILFGSRTNDNLRGGDIDLYLVLKKNHIF